MELIIKTAELSIKTYGPGPGVQEVQECIPSHSPPPRLL